jgi:hypothetical protein
MQIRVKQEFGPFSRLLTNGEWQGFSHAWTEVDDDLVGSNILKRPELEFRDSEPVITPAADLQSFAEEKLAEHETGVEAEEPEVDTEPVSDPIPTPPKKRRNRGKRS